MPMGVILLSVRLFPPQAPAQVCELTWQLRGQAGQRPVENAKVGFCINAGKHGNSSAVIVKR